MGVFQKVSYGGWPNCLRLVHGPTEVVVTTDVGPRIIRYGFTEGPNLLKEFTSQFGLTGGRAWRPYGGHRLWHAPESRERTYGPDNDPVAAEETNGVLRLTQDVELHTGIEKVIELRPLGADRIDVNHRLTNRGAAPIELAPWALTAMAPGGRAIVPQEDYHTQEHHILPARPLVLWPYTNMADARWTWGARYLQLRQDPASATAQKAGVLNTKGWAAYALHDAVFLKRYPHLAGATYPDFGCNTEAFTNADMLEVETLGPLVHLAPGQSTEHAETWSLHRAHVGASEQEIANALEPLVR